MKELIHEEQSNGCKRELMQFVLKPTISKFGRYYISNNPIDAYKAKKSKQLKP